MDIRRGELKEFAESHIEYINPLGGWKAQRCVNCNWEMPESTGLPIFIVIHNLVEINQSIQHMTKFAIILSICVLMLGMLFSIKNEIRAQNVVKNGKVFVQQSSTGDSTKTDYQYQDRDGNKYVIYLSSKGKAYCWLKSKKTGKMYKRYLPKITEELKKSKLCQKKN